MNCFTCPFTTPNGECKIGTIEHCKLEYLDEEPVLTKEQNKAVIDFLTSPEYLTWLLKD